MSTAGAADLERVNSLVKEMVLRYGFNKRLGPVCMMDPEIYMHVSDYQTRAISKMSTELSRFVRTPCAPIHMLSVYVSHVCGAQMTLCQWVILSTAVM